MGRRTKVQIGGNLLDVIEQDFEIVREEWSEYKLLDGGTIKVKAIVQRIFRVLDANGKPKYTADGDPEVAVRHSTQVVAIE